MKIAKIALSADVKQFKAEIEDAKKALSGIGQAKISPEAAKNIANIFSEKLKGSARQVESQIASISQKLDNMAKSGAFDTAKAERYGKTLEALKARLRDINDMQQRVGKGQFPTPAAPGAAGAPSGFLGGMGRAALGLATAVGVGTLYNRREQMADERLKIRALTREGGTINEASAMGFSPAERRARAAEMAQAAGGVGTAELEKLTNLGEVAQRAYGVTEDQSAGAVGAARRAGIQDQGKFLSNSIGAAVAAGLEGSQIGEYLSAMSGYMAEMSRGVNIDGASLNGFAAALGGLPFFKNDPNRIFDALKGINQAFTSGDIFQQAQGTRAILASAPGASPAATEFRRKMGLFGQLDKDTLGNLKNAGVDTRALEVGGSAIVRNIFKDVMSSTEGMSPTDQLYEFQARTGLAPGAAASIFGGLKSGKMGTAEIEKKLQEATMSPEERLAKTMDNVDGTFKQSSAKLSQALDNAAQKIGEPLSKLVGQIDKIFSALGIDTAAAGGTAVAAGAATGAAVSVGAGKVLTKAAPAIGKGASRLATAGAKGGLGGMAKAMGRMGGKGVSRLIPGVGLIMAAKDAWDVYDKYQKGEEITPKDWTILSTSALAGVVGMVPGVGTGVAAGLTAASVGAEFLPDDIGKSQMPTGMPDDQTMGKVLPFKKEGAGTYGPPAPAAETNLGGTTGLEAALRENTAATVANTMGQGRGGTTMGGDRYPSNAQRLPQATIRTGKK